MKQLPAAGCQLPVKCREAKCESRLFFAGAKANQERTSRESLISGMGNETFSGSFAPKSGAMTANYLDGRMKQLPAAGCQLPVKCPEAKCEVTYFSREQRRTKKELREKA